MGAANMNVLVCVKQIPDPNVPGRLDPQTKRLVREGVDAVLDPGDEHAVEAGLQVIEKEGGEATIISMGPPRAIEAIRRALAMGGHRGILITDPGLENSDALSTARAIAAAIKGQSYDLIICGTESTDGSSGAVPAQLAELLGLPLLSFAKKLEVSDGKAGIWVFAETVDGTPTPVVLELLTKARSLGETTAIALGPSASKAVETLGKYGAKKVYIHEDPAFRDILATPAVDLLARLIEKDQ